jgi:uncharacterized OB-fold protein
MRGIEGLGKLFEKFKEMKMANSTCARCNSTRFEMKEFTPDEATHKVMFVQCAVCGTVVGVTDVYAVGSMVNQTKSTLRTIADKLGITLPT